MSKQERHTAEADREESRPASEATPESPEAEADAAEESAEDELTQLRRLNEELNDKYLRLAAEYRNFQQRAARDKEEALRYAESSFARELLTVLDDLERALQAAEGAGDAKTVGEGVRIVYDQFLKVLRDHKIEPIEAVGEVFDPAHHEALLQQPSDEYPAGVVMAEISKGYRMHDRVVRSSRVVVSSGPAAASDAANAE